MSHAAITDPADALAVFAVDPAERIIQTLTPAGSEWHLERDRRQLVGPVVELLRRGGPLLEPYGGKLVAVADGLLPDAAMAQTFVWRPAGARLH